MHSFIKRLSIKCDVIEHASQKQVLFNCIFNILMSFITLVSDINTYYNHAFYYLFFSLFSMQELSSIFRNREHALFCVSHLKVFLTLLCLHYVIGLLINYYKEIPQVKF